MEMTTVRVKVLGGRAVDIACDPDTMTVAQLRGQIQDALGTPSDKQVLVGGSGSNPLDVATRTLTDCGVSRRHPKILLMTSVNLDDMVANAGSAATS